MNEKTKEFRGMFLQLGNNMWSDVKVDSWALTKKEELDDVCSKEHLRFDEAVWGRLTDRMVQRGLNAVVIDIGEGYLYPSHPELSVKGSWDAEKMRKELARLRGMGLEPIPKLNFSTAHDTWLKEYGRMVSTPEYYKVCADVIRDVCEVFDKPRLFHLGYDEETAGNQYKYAYCAVRQGELWWHDFNFFVQTVEKLGMRPWIWSDFLWRHKDEFLKRMPKSVMQSNWYYRQWFDLETIPKERRVHLESYLVLDKADFDQIPCGSNWACDENIAGVVRFCRKHIAPERLKGFLMTTWGPTMPSCEAKLLKGIDLAGAAFAQQ